MAKVINFASEHPELAQDAVPPPSPNSSRGSAGYRERILQLNRDFQRGPLIFERSHARDEGDDVAASVDGSESAADAEAVNASVAGPFLPPDDPAPRTVAGGMDPFTTLVELGQVEFLEPTHFYKLNFDPARLRLAHGGGGVQLLVEIDPDNELETETLLSSKPGLRAVGIQVQPRVVNQEAQYDASDCKKKDDETDDDDHTPSDSTVSSGAALVEHQEFVASRELSK